MYFDRSMMLAGMGANTMLISLKGDKLNYMLQIHFAAFNNVAKYEALLDGLRITSRLVSADSSIARTRIWWCNKL